jgi:hypothetical protein
MMAVVRCATVVPIGGALRVGQSITISEASAVEVNRGIRGWLHCSLGTHRGVPVGCGSAVWDVVVGQHVDQQPEEFGDFLVAHNLLT